MNHHVILFSCWSLFCHELLLRKVFVLISGIRYVFVFWKCHLLNLSLPASNDISNWYLIDNIGCSHCLPTFKHLMHKDCTEHVHKADSLLVILCYNIFRTWIQVLVSFWIQPEVGKVLSKFPVNGLDQYHYLSNYVPTPPLT